MRTIESYNIRYTKFYCTFIGSSLVGKSLSGTAQASVLGNRPWEHSSGPELGHELGRGLGAELGRGWGPELRRELGCDLRRGL